ncbi:hypothetical protein C8R46DRAFT_1105165 [Mycena filopes]|nr:hypothetical protein C8R46DRAFT_1105165 [Mycena filopes]
MEQVTRQVSYLVDSQERLQAELDQLKSNLSDVPQKTSIDNKFPVAFHDEAACSCSICFECLQFPDILTTCGHSFCQKCLVEWFDECWTREVGFSCPQCRAAVDSFPVENWGLEFLIELLIGNNLLTPGKKCTSRAVNPYNIFFCND